jgi:hypothetical protein
VLIAWQSILLTSHTVSLSVVQECDDSYRCVWLMHKVGRGTRVFESSSEIS